MTYFETQVLSRLDSIDVRLAAIEGRFEEATSFASDMINDEGGVLGSFDLDSFKNIMASIVSPEKLAEASDLVSEVGPLQELSEALQGFRERLEGARVRLMDEATDPSTEEEVE
jgi:hypothetical protein